MNTITNFGCATGAETHSELLNRVGQMTRTLHESLRDIGLDKLVNQVAKDIPDTCERLNYVSRMTKDAAERVLDATDLAIPKQSEIIDHSMALKQNWEIVINSPSLKSEYVATVQDTLSFLNLAERNTAETKALLMDIMMAQDFQDLTGQVIKKITQLTHDLESQLLQILIEYSSSTQNQTIDYKTRLIKETPSDSYNKQEDVDDLLSKLGF